MSTTSLRPAIALAALLLGACNEDALAPHPAGSAAAAIASAPAASASAPEPAASASAPAATASAAPAGSGDPAAASASAPSPSGSAAVKKPPLPALADDPPSEEKSKAPTRAEWTGATELRAARSTESRCAVRRLREWVRIQCTSVGGNGFSVVSGDRAGIEYGRIGEEGFDGSWLVFPLRRNDRRMIQLHGWTKWGWTPDLLISEQWLAGDKGPIVTIVNI